MSDYLNFKLAVGNFRSQAHAAADRAEVAARLAATPPREKPTPCYTQAAREMRLWVELKEIDSWQAAIRGLKDVPLPKDWPGGPEAAMNRVIKRRDAAIARARVLIAQQRANVTTAAALEPPKRFPKATLTEGKVEVTSK